MVTIKKETPSEDSASASTRAQQTSTPPPQYTFEHQFQLNPAPQVYQQQEYHEQLRLLGEQNAKRLRMARAEQQASAAKYQQEIKMESQNTSPMPPQVFKTRGSREPAGSSSPSSASSRLQPFGVPPNGSPHSGHALQEYQKQLILLEQQNRRIQTIRRKACRSQTLSPEEDDIYAKFIASGDARDYITQLELLKKQILKTNTAKNARGVPRYARRGATPADIEMKIKKLDDEIRKYRQAEALQNSNASGFDRAVSTCPMAVATLLDSREDQPLQGYETQLLLLQQQNQERNERQAISRQKTGNSETLGNEPQPLPAITTPKGRDIVRDVKDLICIKAELAFTRNYLINFHQNRQEILALAQHPTPSQLLETQGPHSPLTQQNLEIEDEIIKNFFHSQGSSPPSTLFNPCPSKWDEDHHAMEKLMHTFQNLYYHSGEEAQFNKGEEKWYPIKESIHNYFYPEDCNLHPPMTALQRLGQKVGKEMAEFIIMRGLREGGLLEEEGMVMEFCRRYYIPGVSALDDIIVRGLENARGLVRNRRWLSEQVTKQLEERERGRVGHFCRRGEGGIESVRSGEKDIETVWGREGTVDSEWSRINSPIRSTREDTVDSEWSRLDTPGSTREGTIGSEWSRLDTPMEGVEGNEGEGFLHVLPIRSVDMMG